MLCIVTEGKSIPPLGLIYLGSALKKAGYDISIEHITPVESTDFVKKVLKERPLFVGFSIFINSCLKINSVICQEIKNRIDIPIVFGGPHTTILPLDALKLPFVDYVVIGDGEKPIINIIKIIEKKLNPKDAKGIGFKKNNEIIINEEVDAAIDLDEYSLDWSVIKLGDYCKRRKGDIREFSIITSRGCPFQCKFCYNIAVNGVKWRAHSERYVLNHISYLQKEHNINFIRIIDDNIFIDKKRAFSILSKMNIPFSIHCRIDQINKEVMNKLRNVSCKEIMLGVESGSDRILELIGKSVKVGDIMNTFEILSKYSSIKILSSFMLYSPTETKEERIKTIRLIRELYKRSPDMECFLHKYSPCPKTRLFEEFSDDHRHYDFDEWPFFSLGKFYYINKDRLSLIDELENEIQRCQNCKNGIYLQ